MICHPTSLKAVIVAGLMISLFACAQEREQVAEPAEPEEPQFMSVVEVIDITTLERRVVHETEKSLEAPNWSKDGTFLICNGDGLLWRIPIEGGEPEQVNTDFATSLINDHGISPDGTQLVISHASEEDGTHRIYTLPIEGGVPKLVTETGRSYWHGWSPDGQRLTYVAFRNEDYDVYTISVDGGPETRLTEAPGLDEGPDYSADGEYIYFNSERDGKSQIWRVKTDGSEEEQMTFDEYGDWFPHPSPDGQWVAFLSHGPDVEGHPANDNVMLRMMPSEGGDIRVLAELVGGRGTLTSPSWSPDSKQFAFVSYRQVSD